MTPQSYGEKGVNNFVTKVQIALIIKRVTIGRAWSKIAQKLSDVIYGRPQMSLKKFVRVLYLKSRMMGRKVFFVVVKIFIVDLS